MTSSRLSRSIVVLASLVMMPVLASAQGMPDLKKVAGIPLPVAEVPVGTVTVRVIKGSLTNNVAGQVVTLVVDGTARQAKTGDSGRTEFTGLKVGAAVRAVAVVEGERLESQEFAVPATGGIRLLLVATDPDAEKRAEEDRRLPATPVQPGGVVLGEQSRFVFELGEEALNVFGILQIVNAAATPVAPREPVVFEAAANGGTMTVLNGSSPQAKAEGRRVRVAGPFPPGPTLVQFGYSVPYSGSTLTIDQRMPVTLNQVTVLAQKVGETRLTSPQIAQQREMSAQGESYIVGQGPGVQAGDVVSFSFSGLPHAPTWPRTLALSLAGVILTAGAWFSARTRGGNSAGARRADLEVRRDRLFTELTAIEQRHRAGVVDPSHHASKRRELIAELESVYAALDN